MVASLDVQLHRGVLHALLRDDVDDAADRVRAVLRARRAADDLDALDVFRADAQEFVAVAVVLRLAADDALPVDQDECVTRIRAANRYADVAHRIDRARDADFVEDHILDGLRLFARDVFLRDDRRRLGFVFRLFFRGVSLHMNISRRKTVPPPRIFFRPRRTNRCGKPCADRAGKQAVHPLPYNALHHI